MAGIMIKCMNYHLNLHLEEIEIYMDDVLMFYHPPSSDWSFFQIWNDVKSPKLRIKI